MPHLLNGRFHRFYGYDQGVFGNVIISENFLETFGYPSANMQVSRACSTLPTEPLDFSTKNCLLHISIIFKGILEKAAVELM